MKATYSFGECVSRAIGLVHAIISGNCPDKVVDIRSGKEVDFDAPDWSHSRTGCFISRVEASDKVGDDDGELNHLTREVGIWVSDVCHAEKNLITVVMGQEYLDGEEASGWTKWKAEKFYYRNFSSEEWMMIGFSRKKRDLTLEDFKSFVDSRPWVATVGC